MPLIKGLYTALAIVAGINAITSLIYFWPKTNASVFVDAKSNEPVWSWKDTLWLILMVIALFLLVSVALFSFSVYKIRFLMTIIMISYFLGQIARLFPSAEIVDNIVRGKATKMLGINEYIAIITVSILVSHLNTYGILDKTIEYANCQTNTILSDWILLGVYVGSISIITFLICALILRPIKIAIQLLRKIFSYFSNLQEPLLINKLKKNINGTYSTKTWTASLIEYNRKRYHVFRFLLWLGVPFTIILDLFQLAILLAYGLVVSIIWYLICITVSVKKIFSEIGKWILSLSDRNVVIISFRIATILGFGCTVIINQYEPFLMNQETSSVFEFISSTIIIPVILEWVLSYKDRTKKSQ